MAGSLRDRAILTIMFQAGMGIGEFEYFNFHGWSQIKPQLERKEEILKRFSKKKIEWAAILFAYRRRRNKSIEAILGGARGNKAKRTDLYRKVWGSSEKRKYMVYTQFFSQKGWINSKIANKPFRYKQSIWN
jgi:hypothetical protein